VIELKGDRDRSPPRKRQVIERIKGFLGRPMWIGKREKLEMAYHRDGGCLMKEKKGCLGHFLRRVREGGRNQGKEGEGGVGVGFFVMREEGKAGG